MKAKKAIVISVPMAYGAKTLARWCRDPERNCPVGAGTLCPFCRTFYSDRNICPTVTPEMWQAQDLTENEAGHRLNQAGS